MMRGAGSLVLLLEEEDGVDRRLMGKIMRAQMLPYQVLLTLYYSP